MIETALGIVKDEMKSIDVPYEFMMWTSDVNGRYWIGEYLEIPTETEDGAKEYTLILTGTTRNSWMELIQDGAKIEDHFPAIGGLRKNTEKGAVVIFYENSSPIPTGEQDLKRIQVNLRIKAWKGFELI